MVSTSSLPKSGRSSQLGQSTGLVNPGLPVSEPEVVSSRPTARLSMCHGGGCDRLGPFLKTYGNLGDAKTHPSSLFHSCFAEDSFT